jgi:glycosyltransferase involved in cell wall biosynthesis
MIKISAVIITLNEERNLERCLKSLIGVADEIVVLDSHSTDRTIDIANQYNASIYQEKFTGYVRQRNIANEKAAHDWILALDADEELTPELARSILEVKQNTKYDAYQFSRLTNYCGKWIKHCGWYPDKKIRLVNRTKGSWKGEQVHEYWGMHDSTAKIGHLKGDLLHYSFYTISDHVRQIEKFTEMSARAAVENGKSCSILKILIAPQWGFFVSYVVRFGILDGYYGLLVCKLSAYASLLKYSKIRQYSKLKRAGKPY